MIPVNPARTPTRASIVAVLAAIAALTTPIPSSRAQNAAVTVTVDAQKNRRAINPNIYGIAYGSTTVLSDLNVPLNRQGGNNTSRYNWQLNADNRANDWYFESVPDASSSAGERGDTFINNSRAAGAQPMLTIPMIGYVAKLGANRSKLASFSITKYGAQTGSDAQWFADAGNGVSKATGKYITGNNPLDANVANNSAYQNGWIQHLLSKWGAAANGGLKYYILDNEPSIWHGTHRDVHPTGAKMDEVRAAIIDYSRMIRSNDPNALIVGPEEWGWSGFFYSGYDQQWGGTYGWSSLPDRNAHGGWDYMPWLLDQLRQNDAVTGFRSLDVFSLHYYPQGGEFGSDTSTTMQLRRNVSTRSLWDPNYVDQTWINARVQLIPRMKAWVNTYYPGLQTGITEYNWGAEGHINGATTQADIWGIFGREGLDMAARWTYPAATTPTYKAMKLYRNYDGNKSTFGDTSVYAGVPNPDSLSAFAATRSTDGALTIMVINKALSGNTPVALNLAGFAGNGTAQVWQLTSANAINRLSDLAAAASVSLTVPPQSVTLLVLPAGSTPTAPSAPTNLAATAGDSQVSLSWNASSGATSYNVKRSTTAGTGYATVQSGLTSTSYVDTGLTNGVKYYYVVSAVNAGGESGSSNETSAIPQASSGAAVRINSAGPLYNGTTGQFIADKYFTGGSTADRGSIAIGGTSDPTLYRTLRYNKSFAYSVPTTNGTYALTLHFAETGVNKAGLRRFNVSVNGAIWLSAFDVFAAAGGQNKAIKKSTTVTVVNGKIDVAFDSTNGQNAFVNAIELELTGDSIQPPAPPSAPTNLAATAGDSQVSLSWNASSGAATYNVKRSTIAGTGYSTIQSGLTSTSYVDTGLTNGIKYYYVVSAVNAGGESGSSNETSAIPQASSGTAVRINSAGPLYNGTSGQFLADSNFTSGATTNRGSIAIANTSDPALYQTLRYNPSFGYSIPLANGTYTLTLHFAETSYNSAGARKFNVSVNGAAWLSALDVWSEAGGINKALKKSTTVTVTNGRIDLAFASGSAVNAFVNAIELAPTP